ncbi:hypothetical protein DFH09DRAFT_1101055 [Mycena vulgaris]|nr:hypothetical protein DFH09DRAFT_1101055 [Mycena vulgaris]
MAAASWHLIGVGPTLAMVFARRGCNLTLNNAGSLSPPTPAVRWLRLACGLSLGFARYLFLRPMSRQYSGNMGLPFWNQFPKSRWEKSRNAKDENFKEGQNDYLMIANIRPRKACYVPTLTMEQRKCATPVQRLANTMASVCPTPIKCHEAAAMALACSVYGIPLHTFNWNPTVLLSTETDVD